MRGGNCRHSPAPELDLGDQRRFREDHVLEFVDETTFAVTAPPLRVWLVKA